MKKTQMAANAGPQANEWLRRIDREKAMANCSGQSHYGKLLSPMNEPVTRREFRTLIAVLCQADMYIKESEYRALLGVSRSTYWEWKKLGKLDNGYHPASLGCRKRLINRYYNVNTRRVEIPGLNCTEPVKPTRKPRKSSGKSAKGGAPTEAAKENAENNV